MGKKQTKNLASQTNFQQSSTAMWERVFSTKQVNGEKHEGISNICFDRTGPQQLTKAQNNRTIPTFLPSRKIKCLQGLVVGRVAEVGLSVWLYDWSKYLHQKNSSDNCEGEKKVGLSQVKLLDLKHESGKVQGYPDEMGKNLLTAEVSCPCVLPHKQLSIVCSFSFPL